jgi:2-keto-4-pentenoate hydratase
MSLEDDLWDRSYECQPLPDRYAGSLSRRQAYDMQLELLSRHVSLGDRHSGWKVGATSLAILTQQGLSEPLFGYLLESGEHEDGHIFDYDELMGPAFEGELCFTIGDRPLRAPVSFDSARHAIALVHPAIELVEERIDLSFDLNLVIADNIQQRAYVIGPGVPLADDLDLSEVKLDVKVDNETRGSATEAEVLGHPLNSVVWLANKLGEFGLALEPGARVMSGSPTAQFELQRCSNVRAEFAGLGSVSLLSN